MRVNLIILGLLTSVAREAGYGNANNDCAAQHLRAADVPSARRCRNTLDGLEIIQ